MNVTRERGNNPQAGGEMRMSLIDKIDDALNPIVVKELRQAVQSRVVVTVLVLFLLLQLVVMGIYLVSNSINGRLDQADYQAGREVFGILHGFLLGTCMLFLPGYTGIRLGAERSDTNVDLLFITTLKPRAIVTGKFSAALVLGVMMFSACTPFMAFTYFLRGIDLPSIFVVITLDFLAVMSAVMVAIFLAVIPALRPVKALLFLFALWPMGYIFAGALMGGIELLERGITGWLDNRLFLLSAVGLLFGVLGVLGLLYTWSVALVHPPSANRAWPMRLLVSVLWLLGGLLMGAVAIDQNEDRFLGIWIILAGALMSLCLAIAINEREQWATRVARQIPRRPLWRVPAFLFYSGAAGGILHACLFFGLTALVVFLWLAYDPTGHAWRGVGPHGSTSSGLLMVFEMMLLLFLYTFAYALSAVLVRRALWRYVPRVGTWVVMLILAGLVSVLPLLVGVLWQQSRWHYQTHYYWLLTNPVAAMMSVVDYRSDQREVFHLFVGGWAGLVAVLNVTWFFRQMRRFHPPIQRDAALPVAVLAPAAAEGVAQP
jgi:hypothetical protein